jgi:hypothetical protein
MLYEGLDTKSPLGLQKLLAPPPGVVSFEEVRYAGGYSWHMPLMRDELGRVDDRVPGERVFTTPGESSILFFRSLFFRVEGTERGVADG